MRIRSGEARALTGMLAVVLCLHLVGWGVLAGVVAPRHDDLGGGVVGLGLGLAAYLLGMRHAFDVDHLAAIDAATRTLLADRSVPATARRGGRTGAGKAAADTGRDRPLSVGFYFSLGHSTVVALLVLLLGLGIRSVAGQLESGSFPLQRIAPVLGSLVSGSFLLILGATNLAVLLGLVGIVRRLRAGKFDEAELARHLASRGLLARVLSGATAWVRRPAHLYPVGLLFGLGFDTATEVGLLVLAGGAAAFPVPWYAILTLPVLFAAGMSLLDSLDGAVMALAYGWADVRPARKIYYNLVITGLSVLVALTVGALQLLSVLTGRFGVGGGLLAAVGGLDRSHLGYGIAGLFLIIWLVALAGWRLAGSSGADRRRTDLTG